MTHILLHKHVHVHTYTRIILYIHTHTYPSTYCVHNTLTHAHTHTHIHAHTCTCVHAHARTHTRTHTHTYTHTHVMHMYTHVHTCTHTHTYIHTHIKVVDARAVMKLYTMNKREWEASLKATTTTRTSFRKKQGSVICKTRNQPQGVATTATTIRHKFYQNREQQCRLDLRDRDTCNVTNYKPFRIMLQTDDI